MTVDQCDENKPCGSCARHGVQCSLVTWDPDAPPPEPVKREPSASRAPKAFPDRSKVRSLLATRPCLADRTAVDSSDPCGVHRQCPPSIPQRDAWELRRRVTVFRFVPLPHQVRQQILCQPVELLGERSRVDVRTPCSVAVCHIAELASGTIGRRTHTGFSPTVTTCEKYGVCMPPRRPYSTRS
jgi:hypothetical protein